MATKLTAKRRKEMRMTPEEDPEFQIAPMIDVLLVLLVFFMSISTTEVMQSDVEVVLPVASHSRDPGDNPSQIILNVLWNPINDSAVIKMGSGTFDSPDGIIQSLNAQVNRNPMIRVLVRADADTRYEYTRELLRAVGDAGVSNITFSVFDKEVPGMTPGAQ